MKLAAFLLFALTGCAQGPTPEARYLSTGTIPVCLVLCFVTTNSTEASEFPSLRTMSGTSGLTKTTTNTSTQSASQ